MKVLAFSDLHGDRDKAKELAERAEKENVDLVLMCGDIARNDEEQNGLVGIFKNKRVLLVSGNHDWNSAEFWAELYNFKNLHGDSSKYYDIGFFGCGLANMGVSALSEDDFFNTLKAGFDKISNTKQKVMITHNHPADTKSGNFSKLVQGSMGIRKAIDEFQPDIAICGHIHEAEGFEEKIGKTRLINVGRKGFVFEMKA